MITKTYKNIDVYNCALCPDDICIGLNHDRIIRVESYSSLDLEGTCRFIDGPDYRVRFLREHFVLVCRNKEVFANAFPFFLTRNKRQNFEKIIHPRFFFLKELSKI
jgi:hypothetical protein